MHAEFIPHALHDHKTEDAPQNFPALETGPLGLFLKAISFPSLFACLIRSSPH